jgi:hypothetical protein
MSVVIDGTTGISGNDGSAATPALRGDDANTGMFFPAADTIAFAEGGVEVMRITSNAKVGIGTTTPFETLHVAGTLKTDSHAYIGGFALIDDNLEVSYDLLFADSSIRCVGIGTNTPTATLDVLSDSSGSGIRVRDPDSTFGFRISTDGLGNATLRNDEAGSIVFATNFADHMTITSAGDVDLVGSLGVGTNASGTAGEIVATGDIIAYYSDDRLKTRIGPIDDALGKLMTLSGFYYEPNETAQALGYKVKKEVGVSAQEVQAVMPEVVAPAPIDDKYLTVRYERLVPLLIEAIKQQQTQIDKLTSKLGG